MLQQRTCAQWRQRFYWQNKRQVERSLEKIPEGFSRAIRRKYNQILFDENIEKHIDASGDAVQYVETQAEQILQIGNNLNLAAGDAELRALAKKTADEVTQLLASSPLPTAEQRFTGIQHYLNVRGVYICDDDPPEGATYLPTIGKHGVTVESNLRRITDQYFWRRVFRKQTARAIEKVAIAMGMVNLSSGAYASNETVIRFRAQRKRNRALLESLVAVNELGENFTLQELADVSVSNPAIRRAELMTRIAGFERVARDLQHAAVFLTVTCPSKFHAFKAVGSGKHRKAIANEKYTGHSPRDAQQYLASVYARVRAALHRNGIKPYGFRIAEPHHDGCPHWHLMLFVEQAQVKVLIDTFKEHFTREDAEEITHDASPRFKAVMIDWQRGSAAGYVAKYISKNIDGAKPDGDSIGANFDGFDAITAAERVQAWASVWGIRQFQQIGIAPVTLWRELRRIAQLDELLESELLERAATAADTGDWAEYIRIIGGTGLKLADLPLCLHRETDLPNRYGELTGQKVTGVLDRHDGDYVRSRIHEWAVEFSSSSERSEFALPWTRVNNCTRPQLGGTTSQHRPPAHDFELALNHCQDSWSVQFTHTPPPNPQRAHIQGGIHGR